MSYISAKNYLISSINIYMNYVPPINIMFENKAIYTKGYFGSRLFQLIYFKTLYKHKNIIPKFES